MQPYNKGIIIQFVNIKYIFKVEVLQWDATNKKIKCFAVNMLNETI